MAIRVNKWMRYLRISIFFILLGFSLSKAQGSQQNTAPSPSLEIQLDQPGSAVKAQQLQSLFLDLYNSNQFNGCVAVIEKGRPIYQGAFGWANVAFQDTLQLHTPFRLASVSKQFTAMAILILKEEGKLNLNDPIIKYLPSLPYKDVSIRNLLNHNSGIPDYFPIAWPILKYYPKKKLLSNEDMIRYFSEKKPKQLFKPATKAAYSNTGYVFLASIVEKASGISFARFLHDRIFAPLEMEDSYVYTTRDTKTISTSDTVSVTQDTIFSAYNEIRIRTNIQLETRIRTVPRKRAYGYKLSYPYPDGYTLFDYQAFDGISGEKSICSSVYDLMKWDKALHEHCLVSAATMAEAYQKHPITNKPSYGYGFGWKVFKHNPRIVFHHGLYSGYRNYIQRNLDTQTTVIVLSNRSLGGKLITLQGCINQILEGKKYKSPKPSKLEKKTLYTFQKKLKIQY